MTGNLGQGFGVVVILGIDAVLILGFDAGNATESTVIPAQFGAAGGIVRNRLGDDVLCTGQSGGHIGHFLVEVVSGNRLGIQGSVLLQNGVGQRLQPPRLGNAGAGLALGLIGAVEILHFGQCFGLGQRGGQLRGHGSLLGDGGGDLLLALVQSPQVFQTVPQVAQHLVVHRAGGLLAVTGNERDGVALVDQVDGPLHILDTQIQFGGQLFSMIRHSVSSFSYDTKPEDIPHRSPPRPG